MILIYDLQKASSNAYRLLEKKLWSLDFEASLTSTEHQDEEGREYRSSSIWPPQSTYFSAIYNIKKRRSKKIERLKSKKDKEIKKAFDSLVWQREISGYKYILFISPVWTWVGREYETI
jgi:hypothetical protein